MKSSASCLFVAWHNLRHAFAERNAGHGLVWLRDRHGHSRMRVTERYLRNVLNVDTGKMEALGQDTLNFCTH